MRIAIFTHNYPLTSKDRKDAGIFLYDFAHEIAKKHKVFIFCPDFKGEKEKYLDVPVTWFEWGGGKEKFGDWKIFDPKTYYKLAKLVLAGQKNALEFVKKNKIDYILAAWSFPSGIFAQYASQRTGVPYSTWSLGSDINVYAKLPVSKQWLQNILARAQNRFANSYLLCDNVKLLSKKDCVFMPAITNFGKFNIEKIKIDKSKINFLYVGRLEKIKGPDILLQACKILRKSKLRFELHVLGDGKLKPKFEANKFDNVHFYGNSDKSRIAGFMQVCDYLIIPSRNESLPLVFLEAAKMGLPIIATQVGDCRRLVEKYKVGYSVVPNNPQKLAEVMVEAAKERNKQQFLPGLKKIAREFVQSEAVKILLKSVKI